MEKTLYTLIVHSEHFAGILNQITTIFTRRQLNIESLNVSASSIKGVHKYTITTCTDLDTIVKVTKQIEKRIDVVKANYFTEDEIIFREIALYKIPTAELLASNRIESIIASHNARILEVNETFTVLQKSGTSEETTRLYEDLAQIKILQFVRSGRVAITKSYIEKLNKYLTEREEKYNKSKEE